MRITTDNAANGRPVNWLGANFWSRAGGPLMWRSYDPELIRRELAVLKDHGLTMTRSFFYWPDFMPGPHEMLVALYGALGALAGVRRPVTVTDPQVACDMLVRDDGARFAVLVSHADQPLTVKPVIDDGDAGAVLVTIDGEGVSEGVTVGAFGIMVCEVTASKESA